MLWKKRCFWVPLLLCLLANPVSADVHGLHLLLSPYVGTTIWGDSVDAKNRELFGGRAGLMFGRWIGVEATYGASFTEIESTGGEQTAEHWGADLLLVLGRETVVKPYVLGGWSQVRYDPGGVEGSFNGWEFGGGLMIPFRERWMARIEARDVLFKHDKDFTPPLPTTDEFNHNWFITAGLTVAIGGSPGDEDGDGVPNNRDQCPDTPVGARVDASGCPLDSDGDGIPDGLDRCDNTPRGARVNASGCPSDSDGDGVADGIDRCDNTPGGAVVDASGCPLDSDGDGVFDGLDQCANTPMGARVDGNGCPLDSDSDGVADGIDQCDDTPAGARVDAQGCPLSEKETQLLETGLLSLSDVRFDTGKAIIKPESHASLDEVGQILSEWPGLKVEIGGHTDSVGSAAMNQSLSQRRAQSVLDYLLRKFPGIEASQYTAVGYGESQPVADNTTRSGRAMNRRVEFKVLNRETLKREVKP